MASLTGQAIDQTYSGLIKTADNLQLGATVKGITDGIGTATNMTMSQTSTNFVSGTVDFTGSTVIGVGGGIESGTGVDSIQTNSTITTTPANASGTDSIAIGNGAEASGTNSLAIGRACKSGGTKVITIGDNITANSFSDNSVTIRPGGGTGIAFRGGGVAIGVNAYPGADAVAIGQNALGKNNNQNIAIGKDAEAGETGIAVGYNADASGNGSAALGAQSIANGAGAIALGSVSATTVDTVTMKLLQILNYASMSFADDAAAATGGIPLGGVYHTAGALKIRIA